MTNELFDLLLPIIAKRTQDNTVRALRMILVDGATPYAAAKATGALESTLSRRLPQLRTEFAAIDAAYKAGLLPIDSTNPR